MIHEKHDGVRSLEFLLEHVHFLALSHSAVDEFHLLSPFERRERTEIFLEERCSLLDVDVTYEIEFEIVAVGKAFLIDLEHAVVVELINIRLAHASRAYIIIVKGACDRVLQSHSRSEFCIVECLLRAVDVRFECVGILTWRSENEVSELEHGLEVFLHT